jgi:hypothetical protein
MTFDQKALTYAYQPDPVLPVDFAALEVGLSSRTLRRCHERGEIQFVKLSPRRIGIRRSELERFITSRAY